MSSATMETEAPKAVEFDRSDLSVNFREFLKVAVANRAVDAAEVFVLAMTHGHNERAIIKTVCEYAFNNRHSQGNGHSLIIQAAEKCWAEWYVAGTL